MFFWPQRKRLMRNIRFIVGVNDLRVTTWLSLGAAFQLLLFLSLPPRVSFALPLILLSYRLFQAVLDSRRIYTKSFTHIRQGRWTAPLMDSMGRDGDVSAPEGVVMFVLGAQINHPLGRGAAQTLEVNGMFDTMWKEAQKNRIKWGYLGKTRTFVDCFDENDGLTYIWLSYWKDLKGLQEFSNSAPHRLGMKTYNAGKFPYFGIMHETFYAKKDSFETIYDNFPPFGMGQTSFVQEKTADGFKLQSSLQPATGPGMGSMFERMGKKH